jgi:hypothetical protein
MVDISKPLALWYFIRACKLHLAVRLLADMVSGLHVLCGRHAEVRALRCATWPCLKLQGFRGALSSQYTGKQLEALMARMNDTDPGSMTRIEQFDGMAVIVEPGAWHWVLNCQTNIKCVMDGYVDRNFPAYFQSWYRVRSPYASTNLLSPDYSNIFLAAWIRWRDFAIRLLPSMETEEVRR